MKHHIFALVDANHFYVSCERIFAASLEGKPTIVVGNNDGCVVAVSPEAAHIGIQKGMPVFECQHLITEHTIAVFSSNYALYQDMSDRMMAVLSTFSSHMEVYSIDEAWLDLTHIPPETFTEYGRLMRARVLQWTGIPVSVGIAASKVLCKLACAIVKRHPEHQGVLNLLALSEHQLTDLLSALPVEEVWGIGKRSALRLSQYGILTANALRDADHIHMRHAFGLLAQRAVLELQGICCLPLVEQPKARKGLLVALSFSRCIEQRCELEEAIATYTVRVAEKLRSQRSLAAHLSIFIQTSPFETTTRPYANGAGAWLPFATAFTPDFLDTSLSLLHRIYRESYRYRRAGVYLTQIRPQHVIQPDLFGMYSTETEARQRRLMEAVDGINWRWGRDTLRFGAQGIRQQDWFMHQRRRSPRYTTRWNEILTIS